MSKILITGYAGFIGSNLTRDLLRLYPEHQIVGLDAYTYAARPSWVLDFCEKNKIPFDRFHAIKGDITNAAAVQYFLEREKPDHIIHLAAESHVCRSIDGPRKFFETNVAGTFNLLESARTIWGEGKPNIFHHVSTDEVFGELLENDAPFNEFTQIKPRSPYAASKASSDHIVQSFHHTYGINTRITNCSNNFGPNQHEEKLIPRTIIRILEGLPVLVYGSGAQIRDWIHVDDHCEGLMNVFFSGISGERYCIGGGMEMSNMDLINRIHVAMREIIDPDLELKIVNTNDRPKDDFRYAISNDRISALGFRPKFELFHERIRATINWYFNRHK